MKVIINGQSLRLFKGARVKDAVKKFSELYREEMPHNPYTITDLYGNVIRPDGRLSENEHLYIKPKKT
ncbi:MAG TPA: hypothetical protein VJ876_07105 [Bacteroidales bacterium]|nr:hypothetical protein [Bacteroidales bacterium]